MRFDLSDEEWALLEPRLPKSRKSARVDDRKIVNAIFYVLRTGMPWRDLPACYGPYTTAYNRFNRWSRRGIWKRVFALFENLPIQIKAFSASAVLLICLIFLGAVIATHAFEI